MIVEFTVRVSSKFHPGDTVGFNLAAAITELGARIQNGKPDNVLHWGAEITSAKIVDDWKSNEVRP